MKSIYIKKIIAGIVIFGSYFFFNSGFANDPDVFIGEILCFLLPAVVMGGKRLYLWVISYSLLILSLWTFWHTNIFPYHITPNEPCGLDLLCGVDNRPFIVIFLYIIVLIVLAIWQLISFIQKRNSKGLIQN